MRLVTADRNLGGVSLEMARGVLLRPIEQGTAVEIVVERVRDAIGLGVLAPGERLPAETDLARMLDVGVMTLRAALAQLRDDGLLETRRGRTGGSFVRPASARSCRPRRSTSSTASRRSTCARPSSPVPPGSRRSARRRARCSGSR